MPTNEERREVAARLRMLDASEWSCYGQEFDAIMDACGRYTGQDQQDMELKDRLADLIEPEERTCRWKHIEGTWFMSECGKRYDCIIPDNNFCPNCGAKVVE